MQENEYKFINFMNMLHVACHIMPRDAYTIDYFSNNPDVIHKITIHQKGFIIQFDRGRYPCIIMWRTTTAKTGMVKILNEHIDLTAKNAHKIISSIINDNDPYCKTFWK